AGARVVAASGDIADAADVRRILLACGRAGSAEGLPPLRGIIHAAGVIDDGVLLQQSWPRFAEVMAPKIDGAWHLHALTQEQPLDLFVLFSSASSVMGSPGQANYTAANAFLDGLAHFRHSLGRPALSINWGAWENLGMTVAVADRSRQRWGQHGVEALTVEQGKEALSRLIAAGSAQTIVLPVDWQVYLRAHGDGTAPPLLAELAGGPGEPARAQSLLAELEQTPADRRRGLLLGHVRQQAAAVLGMAQDEQISPHQPLSELGLDSLMAVELRNRLSHSLERPLPATLLFDQPTVEALATHLGDMLVGERDRVELGLSGHSQMRARAVGEIERLSDAEAEALLLVELESANRRGATHDRQRDSQ
ncbi:MAG: KR domain-containing protein, partial [Chloroflexales bacterium]|nr:KR domain-containing protein [Chloroflexales bacterium]